MTASFEPRSGSTPGTVITVAPTGTRPSSAGIPATAAALGSAAADCARIGASVIDLEPRPDWVLTEAVTAARESGALVRVRAEPHGDPAEYVNCGADLLLCPMGAAETTAKEMVALADRRGIAVHAEVRTLAELDRVRSVSPNHVVLVLGEGIPADLGSLVTALEALPPATGFTATGLDAAHVTAMLAVLAAGGHVRTGMADTLRYAEDVPARDNTQLVARAVGLAKIAQRPALDPARAAVVLGARTAA